MVKLLRVRSISIVFRLPLSDITKDKSSYSRFIKRSTTNVSFHPSLAVSSRKRSLTPLSREVVCLQLILSAETLGLFSDACPLINLSHRRLPFFMQAQDNSQHNPKGSLSSCLRGIESEQSTDYSDYHMSEEGESQERQGSR